MRIYHRLVCGIAATVLLALAATSVKAQALVRFDFTSRTSGVKAPAAVATNVTASGLDKGSPGEYVNDGYFGFMHGYTHNSGTPVTDLQNAISRGTYIAFTVAPNTGFTLDLSTINAPLHGQNQSRDVFLLSSLTGFGTAPANILGQGIATTSSNPFNVTLGSAFDSVAAPVEFRYYYTGIGAFEQRGFGGSDSTVRSLTLSGTVNPAVTVPEAGTVSLALAGFALLGGVVLRRRAR